MALCDGTGVPARFMNVNKPPYADTVRDVSAGSEAFFVAGGFFRAYEILALVARAWP